MSLSFDSARMPNPDLIVPPILAGKKRISLGITEPSGGSDVANMQTTARREGDCYIVNGSKTFISGGTNKIMKELISRSL